MSLLKKLFGGRGGASAPSVPEPETYKGFLIFPEPVTAAGGYRISARIEKEVGGEVRTHVLVRADVCSSLDEAADISLRKARQVIDEQGDALLD